MHDAHHVWLQQCFGVDVDVCNHWTAGDNWLYALKCEAEQLHALDMLTQLMQCLEGANISTLKDTCLKLNSLEGNVRELFINCVPELAGRREDEHGATKAYIDELNALVESMKPT